LHNLFAAFYYQNGIRVEQSNANKMHWRIEDTSIVNQAPLEKGSAPDHHVGPDTYHAVADLFKQWVGIEKLQIGSSEYKLQRVSKVRTFGWPDSLCNPNTGTQKDQPVCTLYSAPPESGNTLYHHSFIAVYEERVGPETVSSALPP
jgi:hypothetical protein